MKALMTRMIALAVCVVAPFGWAPLTSAVTTVTLSVTGEVVDAPLTLTLSETSFSFGRIDSTGDVYDSNNPPARTYPINENPLGVPTGMAWFANQGVTLTVSSPSSTSTRICLSSQTNVVLGGESRLYFPLRHPTDIVSDPAVALNGTSLAVCGGGAGLQVDSPSGNDRQTTFYPTFLVSGIDDAHTFAAVIQFSAAAF